MSGFIETIRLVFPLSKRDKKALSHFEQFLDEHELRELKRLLKQGRTKVSEAKLGVYIVRDSAFPVLETATHDDKVIRFVDQVNKQGEEYMKKSAFHNFAPDAFSKISQVLAQQILGFENVKDAITLQLFAKENLHILLIGDPGTGKTELVRAAEELAPISSFGLGSGVSGVGLTVTVKGGGVQKGLLPMADKGLACIDELNLIKKEDLAGLYNAMEKGFVSYDKLGHHFRFDARVNLLATANPRYAQFLGKTASALKKELPFDSALLTRFHLVFFVRKPDVKRFVAIAKEIVSEKKSSRTSADTSFIKDYIELASGIKVDFPKQFEKDVVNFAERIKKDEKKFLVEVSPRLVVGIIRLTKASARMELRERVDEIDVKRALDIVEKSLYLPAQ